MSWSLLRRQFSQFMRLERGLADNTRQAYERDLDHFQRFLDGEAPETEPPAVEAVQIEAFMAYIGKLGLEATTQARMLSGVKAFFLFLVQEDAIATSPADLVPAPRLARHLPDVLSFAEVERVLAACNLATPEGLRARAMVELLYGSGLRVSELCGLQLHQVYADVGLLRVRGKGDKERLVPSTADALAYLARYIAEVRSQLQLSPKAGQTIFLHRRGGPLSRISVFKTIKELVAQAGITKTVSPHTFRHSFATHLVEGGADLRAVQEMLGHESITTTEIYTHLDATHLRQAIDLYHPMSRASH